MNINKAEAVNAAEGLFRYIKKGTSPYHVVNESEDMLSKEGFMELNYLNEWKIEEGGRYYIKAYGKSLFAFTVGNVSKDFDFHIAAAHTDQPCLHVKPKAELETGGCLRINTEVYGGPILNTWLDRPLSAAGSIALKSSDVYQPKLCLLDMEKSVFTIPNLAIHMNRDVNQGIALKKQSDMLPLFAMACKTGTGDNKNYFTKYIAECISVEPSDILDFDLCVYVNEPSSFIGAEEEFIQAPRLDNLASCYALIRSLIAGRRDMGINLIALYDNEEIGSRTKQGADSNLLRMIIEKLCASLNLNIIKQNEAIMRSFLFSVDAAHALHPSHQDKYDPVNKSLLNDGVVLKINSNQRYTFDTEAIAIAQQLCEYTGVKYEKFVNNSDMPGGGTLGPIISSYLPMKTVDIGIGLLAMHSARELMGTYDLVRLENLLKGFFTI